MKKISLGVISVAAFVLFAIITIPTINIDSNQQGQQGQGEPKVDSNNDKEEIDQKEPNLYENAEYGFIFSLPKSWEGYQIVLDSWEGISSDQQPIENGQILLIRHPVWTEDKPRQDIPIMIFTLKQWSSLQNGEFHIGAAPIGPTMLGQNNEYVFALPGRYNYAFLEGYEEVEDILENNPLKPKNVVK